MQNYNVLIITGQGGNDEKYVRKSNGFFSGRLNANSIYKSNYGEEVTLEQIIGKSKPIRMIDENLNSLPVNINELKAYANITNLGGKKKTKRSIKGRKHKKTKRSRKTRRH